MPISYICANTVLFFCSTSYNKMKEEVDQILEFSESQEKYVATLNNLIDSASLPSSDVIVPEHLWNDIDMKPWIEKASFHLKGTRLMTWKYLKAPTSDVSNLERRQAAIREFPVVRKEIRELASLENDVLWAFSLPHISNDATLQLLFPQSFGIKYINHIPPALLVYHLYRAYWAPYMSIITPISTVLGPLYYVRRHLKWNIGIKAYFNLLWMAVKQLSKPSGNLKSDLIRLVTLIAYVSLFVVGTIQSFEISKLIRRMYKVMGEKLESIRQFVATSSQLFSSIPQHIWTAFGFKEYKDNMLPHIPRGMSGLFKILVNPLLKRSLQDMMHRIYLLDTCSYFHGLIQTKYLTQPTWHMNTPTRFWNMGHISLHPQSQVRNPVDLAKNLIITGPNAAGKTTYVKTIGCNLLLAQTFGVAVASKANVTPVHAIGSFMRVQDTLGSSSLFQAEAKRCMEIVHQAETLSASGKNAIYFLDEPMHSTPPTEGAATSMSVAEHLGKLANIRTVLTTHFFHMTTLEKEHPSLFYNISMEAIPTKNGFNFPYRIRKGPSFQCIALELLEEDYLPKEIVVRAIEWKNKLCRRDVDTYKYHDS